MSAPDHTGEDQGNRGTFGDMVSNIKTPAVKNMEAAWSRAGASNHHTPGAATKLGSQDQVGASETEGASGVGSTKFANSVSDQREEPSVIGKVFNNLINGTDKTK